jgi:hypothetical protein
MNKKENLFNEKISVCIALGMHYDHLMRSGVTNGDEQARTLSAKLHALEAEIYKMDLEQQKDQPKKCPNCENQIENNVKFCNACGFNIETFNNKVSDLCTCCSAKNSTDANYCMICGTKK